MTIPFETEILARTIYGEARGESMEGKVAVASVILNRIASKKFRYDETITGACLRYRQFSCWNRADANFAVVAGDRLDTKTYLDCVQTALRALEGQDPTNGATHYHTKSSRPAWSRGKAPCAVIGCHKFFNDIA